jgi:hypothetical protein
MKHFTPLDLPQYDLLSCMNELLQQQTIDWGKHNQICINTTSDQPDNYHHGDASLKYDWNNTIDESDKDGNITNFTVPLRDKYLREKHFTQLCSVFENTIFADVYQQLSSQYTLGRVRLMTSLPKTCLTWHQDSTNRIHYPLVTDPGCQMVIEDEVLHMPENTWWLTQTENYKHTAFNASTNKRIHLVAVVRNAN